jgi:hypothetical protein
MKKMLLSMAPAAPPMDRLDLEPTTCGGRSRRLQLPSLE